ncbi:MAG: hypothetical protein Q4D81_03860 [Eubacteriales bacterium]|nr:hypothetical protein [Eubacteriales bacterium]
MNLTAFLKAVDEQTGKMDLQECTAFIHEIARGYSENQRQDFLRKLKDAVSEKGCASGGGKTGRGDISLEEETAAVLEQIDLIEGGELQLNEEYNDAYDDWYNSDVEEILYKDPDGIKDILEEAAALAHTCYDRELYGLSRELYGRLRTIDISTDGEYSGEALSLEEAVRMDLLDIDLDALIRESIISTYLDSEPEERAQEIFDIFSSVHDPAVTLESFLQSSVIELPGTQEFLKSMVSYLGNKRGRTESRLIEEALSLEDSWDDFHAAAKEYAADHPGLYKTAVFENPGNLDREQLYELSMEALEKIPERFAIRSEIALKAADLALVSGRNREAEIYRIEVFRSEVSPVNFWRAYLESENSEHTREALRGIYSEYIDESREILKKEYDYSPGYAYSGNETRETSPGRNALLGILFFDGRFEEVLQYGMRTKNAVGWSSTFMKQGMALFMLDLYQGKDLPYGCRAINRQACEAVGFRAKQYCKGTERPDDGGTPDEIVFAEYFSDWKKRIPMSGELQESVLQKMEGWIRERVQGIMEGNHRRHYGECAAYIAAYGEILESRGSAGAKARIMENYRCEYSRRRAFHEELRRFGMKDRKKK